MQKNYTSYCSLSDMCMGWKDETRNFYLVPHQQETSICKHNRSSHTVIPNTVTIWLLFGLQTSQTYQYCKAPLLLWNRVAHLRGMSNNIYETQLLTYLHLKLILGL